MTYAVRHRGTRQLLWPTAGIVVLETVNRISRFCRSAFLDFPADLCVLIAFLALIIKQKLKVVLFCSCHLLLLQSDECKSTAKKI